MKLYFIILAIVLTLMASKVLVEDIMMVDDAIDIQIELKRFCDKNNRYPTKLEFENLRPWLRDKRGREWYYWVKDNYRSATFQYPMSFPLPFAPGRAKVSEFIPVIYANAVNNPCLLK
ncbi:hypothetical protein [Bacteriovorax sp. Seq25_V]|uniref:hypothetical protein n=1 Tax=Bacteriovorax sp. Seq25_V TaxID=1201288 RepID=UPI000389EC43|nr:hypothetical protein [Bacteriovorax sp. Seq25_V]EQC48012.1 hypothetical protein M900_A0048 [Bacteriovorax sp. Seq25_V]